MSLLTSATSAPAPFARQQLRHSAGRGQHRCFDWLYYLKMVAVESVALVADTNTPSLTRFCSLFTQLEQSLRHDSTITLSSYDVFRISRASTRERLYLKITHSSHLILVPPK